MNTNTINHEECPACGSWKPTRHEFCHDCFKYRDELLGKRQREKEQDRLTKRMFYFASNL